LKLHAIELPQNHYWPPRVPEISTCLNPSEYRKLRVGVQVPERYEGTDSTHG